jgi:LytS/YehU family sensor histidine kinase
MLRYQLYEMNGNKIAIEKEIQYLHDYIDLQKLRKDDQYIIEFSYSPDVKGFSIEPLLLIPFVENAFKHISHYREQPNFIKIRLSMDKSAFTFDIENSKEPEAFVTDRHSGIGLVNVKRRLALLYAEKYKLVINDGKDIFHVALTIKI